ncbi:hypothetical protein HBO34_21925 [Pseudomonas veronii]|uniref:DUF6124 family protein n=1 Tax=Pseudomonas veronii TaxID=76761 RepID=UPI001474C764|nr:DUF6124 family protein [Pseudomonas veronii]NMX40525.1 hypothetical protein [Pseudomonas veronii]
MYKVTPNPPYASNALPADAKLHAAAQRAIPHYLPPAEDESPLDPPTHNLFLVSPDIDTETLLANASENLASASEMAATVAFNLDESQRSIVLGIQQLIDLSALLVDRAHDQVARVISPATA